MMKPLLLAMLVGCQSTTDTGTGSLLLPGDPAPGTPAGTSTDTFDSAVTSPPSFDCTGVPDTVGSPMPLAAPRGYNDVAFTLSGSMVGWDGAVLLEATDPATTQVYAPGIDMVYKLGTLPGGDLVASLATGDVIRIQPNGNSYPIVQGLFAYGLAVGSDGMVYAATNYDAAEPAIWRIDPDTQQSTLLFALPYLSWPRDISFSRDYRTLYIGTQWYGAVLKLPLDGNLDPTGPPTTLTSVPTQWHDTVQVDACGNLYVAGLFPPQLHRIHHDLSAPILMAMTVDDYAHGFQWGVGGAWDEQSIFTAHPDESYAVKEVVLGVPGATWSGDVVGGGTL